MFSMYKHFRWVPVALLLILASPLGRAQEAGNVPAVDSLDARVAAAITAVREDPPVHLRPEPWTVSIEELVLELQPLRKDQIDERVQAWLEILQQQIRERIRMDIALRRAQDPAETERLAAMSTRQQAVVQAITDRVNAVLLSFQKRGGDASEYLAYLNHATGQPINYTDPEILTVQVRSWLVDPQGGIGMGVKTAQFFLILAAFWVVSRLVSAVLKRAVSGGVKPAKMLQTFVVDGSRRVLMLAGLVVALGVFGVNMGPVLAIIGALGLVVGLALQGTLSNFASGILILLYRPFDTDDVVSVAGVVGKVENMNLFSTRILTFDNQVMLVPNNSIWGNVITNITALETRRVDLMIGVSYGDDLEKATRIITETVQSHPLVLPSPAPMIKVHELGDSSVNFIVRPWAKTSDYWDVYWDLTKNIKLAFDAQGITIPFPQRELHVANAKALPGVNA